MTERERRPTEICETIRGVHADIALSMPVDLDAYLDSVCGNTTLYRDSSGTLKYPIEEARLDYHREDSDDINFSAEITFGSDAANAKTRKSWQAMIRRDLLDILNEKEATVYTLKHQAHDFYVALDNVYAAFVQFDADTHGCAITISLEKLHEVHYALGDEADEDEDAFGESYHYEVLKEISGLWSLVIDATVDRFGDNTLKKDDKPQIVIAAPVDSTDETYASYEDDDPKRFIPGITIPEAETNVSDSHGFVLIGGLRAAIERLEDIASTFRDPDGAAMYGISGRHFILHGPVGTGKTSLVKAFAHEIGANIRFVNSTDLVDMWVGNSGKNTRNLFNAMKEVEGPLVVFFDEFDTLARKGTGGTSERVDVKKYLNTAIDDISKNHPNIIIAAATNVDMDDLEPSLIRSGRLEPIGAPAPNEEERVDVWAAVLHRSWLTFNSRYDPLFDSNGYEYTETFTPYENDLNPMELARLTDGMTGADFEIILESARRKHYRNYRRTGEATKVSQVDLIREIKNFGR